LPVGLDDMDEGYFVEQATRVLRGELPYRDFDTLYTPGLLYLHAGLFSLFGGPHLIIPRLMSFLTRVALAFGLYALARPLTRPGWAALPALFLLLGLDRSPLNWEPHPNWQSTLATVAAVGLFGRLPTTTGWRRIGCLMTTGALAALTFAFKQNAGLLIGLAAGVYLLLDGPTVERRAVTPTVRAVQLAALGGVLTALGALLQRHPQADALLFAYLWAPIVGLGLLLTFSTAVSWQGARLTSRLGPLVALAAGFVLATLPWLLALLIGLGGQVEYLRGFVGGLDIRPLALPVELPSSAAWLAVLGFGLAAITAVRLGWHADWVPVVPLAGFGGALVLLTREPGESLSTALLLAPGRAGYGLQAFIPVAATWSGIWLARRTPRTVAEWRLRWYVAAGAITFITQFPRLDNFHLLWTACIPLVLAATALGRLHDCLARRWRLGRGGRVALVMALLVVPVLAGLPTLYVRGEGFVKIDAETGRPFVVPLARLDGPPAVEGLFAPEGDRDQLASLASYLRSTTAPDEPIFVYPTSPLVYVAADRRNPTRYAHLYPGGASPAELERLVVTLEAEAVRTVVVSDGWLFVWSTPGDNAGLEDYLASTFQDTARFGTYRVLTRKLRLPL
jgi:hypothetical protein